MSEFAPQSTGLLKPLQRWLDDKAVSEILINRPQEVFIETRNLLEKHVVKAYHANRLNTLFQLIANENKQLLSPRQPLLSGNLLDGSRVQLVVPPASTYHALSIRRKVAPKLSLADLKTQDFYQTAKGFDVNANLLDTLSDNEKTLLQLYQAQCWDAFIQKAILFKKNIVISGGTSSGKTTFLNACLRYIPMQERIITLEDTREIDILHPNQVNLVATKGNQGLAQISMQDLVQCCLRLRPDRMIVGEIRGKEVLDFVSACSTGHEGSLTTIHANNPKIALMRMTQMYKLNHVPSMQDADIMRELQAVIDVIVQVAKTPKGRQVQSIYYKYANLGTQIN